MRLSRTTWCLLGVWAVVVGSYTAVALWVPAGPGLTAFGNVVRCLVPLFANAGLLLNAGSPHWRKNAFWMLLALGCTLWMAAQFLWTYSELVLHQPVPHPFLGDVIIFLHIIPMIGALALQPHELQPGRNLRFGYLDFTLLLLWWVYLYVFIAMPWQYVLPTPALYQRNYIGLYALENLVLLGGLAMLCLRTGGRWRVVYAHLFGAVALHASACQANSIAVAQHKYYAGSIYDLPLVASFVWFATAGIVAYRLCPDSKPALSQAGEQAPAVTHHRRSESAWRTRLAMAAVLPLPLAPIWCILWSTAPRAICQFRVLATLVASLPLSFLLFLRQQMVDAERLRLLRASEESIENLKRLQTQLVQSEKLASLGQVAAGAAHEINNPLTAILGYSDLLIDDATAGERARSFAEKIREQARRTKTLVTNLLSFARQVPAERTLLDINAVVTGAVQLRGLDLRGKNIRIETHTETVLPAVRGDPNGLLQVCFNIISNAVDALEEVGGGVLTVKTLRERANVVVLFSDTGPGIKEPDLVFDPFYTTKPVGRGTGLGLSICYGLVQEHGGHISCCNRPEGGATFRVELPAVMPLFPAHDTASPASRVALKSY